MRQSDLDGTPPRLILFLLGDATVSLPLIHIKAGVFRIPLIQRAVTVTPTAPIGHGVWRRQSAVQTRAKKPPENADDGALVGTLALTPDDPKHELACRSLWTLKDDVPPFLTAPLSVGQRNSEDPRWIRRSSVFLFQG